MKIFLLTLYVHYKLKALSIKDTVEVLASFRGRRRSNAGRIHGTDGFQADLTVQEECSMMPLRYEIVAHIAATRNA